MKCANCNNVATYVYKPGGGVVINYCSIDLPRFLKDQKTAGLLEITDASKAELRDATLILNNAKEPEVEATPVVEEPVVVEEKPKKTTKKAEPVQPDVE